MDSSGAVGLDESPSSPSPSLSPLPGPRSPRPLFYGGSPSEEETEEGSQLVTAEDVDAGSSTDDPWTSEELSESLDDSDPTSWGTSPAGDKPAQLLSKASMRKTARTAIKTGTGIAHTVAAKTEGQRAVELYKADDEDAAAIGDPLADLMYRRGDIVGGKLSPDANDFLRSMMGVAGYLTKQIQKLGIARTIDDGQAAGEVQTIPRDVA